MKLFPECMSCLIEQVARAIRLLKPDTPKENIVIVQQKLMGELSKLDLKSTPNVLFGAITYRLVGEFLNEPDPYHKYKREFNQKALGYEKQVKQLISQSQNPLNTAIRFSILGNAIDFGTPHGIDLEAEINSMIGTEPQIKRNIANNGDIETNEDINGNNDVNNTKNINNRNDRVGSSKNFALEMDKFLEDLKNANNVLILGDNCGEIVFDKWMLEELTKIWPNKSWKYSVRSGPIINYATMEDAIEVGIDKVVEVIEASPTPGIHLEGSTQRFKEAFAQADFILSKGQGNFESLIDIDTSGKIVYFLLKAKCVLMTKIFGVRAGTLLLVEKSAELLNKIDNL